ncbi:MAG: type II toxin-antitoxin system PemK/MazF family toxin [Nanoarchaeota archaeon]|nr:type II toxin-antitoxin system PemK/MazF family toxin [Nanoarchaeota archaeon]
MEGLVKGDVIVIDFPFSSLKESKRRPVLILKVPKGGDIIVNQITGSSYEKSVEIKIENNNFKQGSLKRESFVRIDKIGSIEKTLIKYKVGSLKPEKFNEIIDRVISFLKY